jgi:hypothetical protein
MIGGRTRRLRWRSPLTIMLSGPGSGEERSTRNVPSNVTRLVVAVKDRA